MTGSYSQYCPIARAADILSQRWTILILRDLHAGCRRFNELKRGVPRMSPTLLSQRLKQLEHFGLIERCEANGGAAQYRLTPSGEETRPLVDMFGIWGQRWIRHKADTGDLDETFLIYAIQCGLDISQLAPQAVVHIVFCDKPKLNWDRWWLIVEKDGVESCFEDPGRSIDVQIESDLRTLSDVWMGAESARAAMSDGRIAVDGERRFVDRFAKWFCGSPFSQVELPPSKLDLATQLERLGRQRGIR